MGRSRNQRRRLGGTVAVGLVVGLGSALAQSPAQDPAEVRQRLEAERRQLTEQDRRAGELQGELQKVSREREQVRTRLLEIGKQIQASEALLSAIEQRRGELEDQEKLVRGSLEARRGTMSTLLAAMQRMGRNPPPVMMTHPDDALAMVRSAMLVGAAFPQLRAQAEVLSTQLQQIVDIRAKIATEEDKLRAATRRYNEESATLASLVDQRNRSARDHQKELELVQQASAEIRRSVSDLGELVARMDKAVAERTRMGAYERELAAAEAAKAAAAQAATSPAPAAASPVPPATAPPATPSAPPAATAEAPAATPEVAPKSVATQPVRPATDSKTAPPAATKPQPRPPDERPAFTLAPGDRTAMASPGRMQPLIPFAQAKGRLPLPAQGKRVISFGDKTQRGKFEGIAIETRHGAQVTAPSDGWVLYAGEFRTFGQLLIINAGGGYTIILSNLAQIDVPVGQFVVAGEPVGTMQAAPRAPAGRVPDNPPVLYVEFRKDRNPIDPDPWWIEPGRRQASLAGPAQLALAAAPGAPVPGAPAPGAPAPGAPAP